MKKVLFILGMLLLFAATSLNAQNKSIYDVSMDEEKILHQYRGTSTDYVDTVKETFTYTVYNAGQIEYKDKFTSRYAIALDSLAGTAAAVKVEFQRRLNVFDTWTSDSSIYFYGTQSDTTIYFLDTTTRADSYRRIKVTHADGFKVGIDWLSFLLLKN